MTDAARYLILMLIAAGLGLSTEARAQLRPAAELQGYPAGGILGVGASLRLGDPVELTGYAGYNITRRRDFGEHDDERGSGPGIAGDLTWLTGSGERGLFLGARADVWLLDIAWRDDPTSPSGPERAGATSITVVQPTARAGYRWLVGLRDLRLDATVSVGAEINVHTDGEDVGEGAILLVGLRLGL